MSLDIEDPLSTQDDDASAQSLVSVALKNIGPFRRKPDLISYGAALAVARDLVILPTSDIEITNSLYDQVENHLINGSVVSRLPRRIRNARLTTGK